MSLELEPAPDGFGVLPDRLPVMPIRDVVVFPYMVVPLFVSREISRKAVEAALAGDRLVFLCAQKSAGADVPGASDLYDVGTVGKILRARELPDDQLKVLVQGLRRARASDFIGTAPVLEAQLEVIEEQSAAATDPEVEGLVRAVKASLSRLVEVGKALPDDVMTVLLGVDDPGALADLVAANLGLKVQEAQAVLEAPTLLSRLTRVHGILDKEVEVVAWQQQIQTKVKEEMSRTQREYFLREQLKQIRQELGDYDDRHDEAAELSRRLAASGISGEAAREASKQLRRLEQMSSESSEAAIVRTYLDWLADLPWTKETPDIVDLARAARILDEDHHGLEAIKERILEYLGVIKLKKDHRGPVLCFVGPPGVGKTSLGRSIARALGRDFVRASLGGVRDESEIRGHRRTYVGAMPGRIVAGLKQAGSRNPVFTLDEIDKLGNDTRGDPSAALLEVLDPEQNGAFRDHYLNLPFDLSRVLWVATANLVDGIPFPLRDRMEIIHVPGYHLAEKVEIARRFLIPRQLTACGLGAADLTFTNGGIEYLIEHYTFEAGVRELERSIAAIARKIARRFAQGKNKPVRITERNIERYLGPRRRAPDRVDEADTIGLATGLGWNEAGGAIIHVEATEMRGRAGLTLTGQLGKVMKESAQAALSLARARAEWLGVPDARFLDHEFHLHVPQGSIPKDGPSAGITMAAALISLLTECPVRGCVAMTGEITLRGRVLPVGGIREKLLAAARAGITEVIVPAANEPDLSEIPAAVRGQIRIHLVKKLEDALQVALVGFDRVRAQRHAREDSKAELGLS
ncbi:MAG: endopeptidase La [Deltaproteobacteria bacterium]|nr:endopeptidase La [Deltaproteobacteria bacterium]